MTVELFRVSLLVNLSIGSLIVVCLIALAKGRAANLLLAGVVVGALLRQGLVYYELMGFPGWTGYLFQSSFAVSALMGPLFYLYCRAMTTAAFRLRAQLRWFHVTPFLFGIGWYGAGLFLFPRDSPEFPSFRGRAAFDLYIRTILIAAVNGACLWASLRQVQGYEIALKELCAKFPSVRLAWLKLLLVLVFLAWSVYAGGVVTGPRIRLQPFLSIVLTISVFAMAIFALLHSEVFREEAEDLGVARERHKVPLTPGQLSACAAKIQEHLETQGAFRQADLRMSDLARATAFTTQQISYAIHEGLHTSFYDLINGYRVEEFKRRVQDPDSKHMSILAIALDCGFNSKSAFNHTFKKQTGMTPGEFRRMAEVSP